MAEEGQAVDEALAALEAARGQLRDQLAAEPTWKALCDLEARVAASSAASDADDERRALETRLDATVPGWRTLERLDSAITALLRTKRGAAVARPAPGTHVSSGAQVAGKPVDPGDGEPGARPFSIPTPVSGNRSLIDAIGSLHSVSKVPQDAGVSVPAEPPKPPTLAAGDVSDDVQSILSRIRSVGSKTASPAAARALAEPETAPPLAPAASDPATSTPAPSPASVSAGSPPEPAARVIPSTPAAPFLPDRAGTSPLPKPPAPWLERGHRRAVPSGDASPSIEAGAAPTRPAIDRFDQPSDALAKAPPVSTPPADAESSLLQNLEEADRLAQLRSEPEPKGARHQAGAPGLDESALPGFDDVVIEEADVEIVALPGRAAAAVVSGRGNRLSQRLGEVGEKLVHNDNEATLPADYAAYHGLVDEASVEIVRLDTSTGRPDSRSAGTDADAADPKRSQAPTRLPGKPDRHT